MGWGVSHHKLPTAVGRGNIIILIRIVSIFLLQINDCVLICKRNRIMETKLPTAHRYFYSMGMCISNCKKCNVFIK